VAVAEVRQQYCGAGREELLAGKVTLTVPAFRDLKIAGRTIRVDPLPSPEDMCPVDTIVVTGKRK